MSAIKKHLTSWAVGRRYQEARSEPADAPGTETIVLDHAKHLAAVLNSDLVGTHTAIFAPQDGEESPDPRLVPYEGSFAEPGAEAVLGHSFYLQIQNYAVSEFMSVVGPTLVRIADDADFAAFLADADRAAQTGTFPSFLTNPVIQLADVPALAGPGADGPRLRLHVRIDGSVSTSPAGAILGQVGDGFADIQAAWQRANAATAHPCGVCLGAVVDPAGREAARAQRPWLARYLAAVDAIRSFRARGVEQVNVSGFGQRLHEDLGAGHTELADDPAAPLVLWTDEATYIYDPESARAFQTSSANGRVADALIARGLDTTDGLPSEEEIARVTAMFADAGLRLPVGLRS